MEIITVITDEEGGTSQFLSPTVLDAAQGVGQAITAAIARTGLTMMGEGGEEVRVPERMKIKLYKAELEESGKRALGHTVQKLMKAEFQFYPGRFRDLKYVPDPVEPREVDMGPMVTLE